MAQAPAFSFYAKDFLTGAAPLSLSERGAYITLLSYQWDSGSVPDDATARARILGCSKREEAVAWAGIVGKFDRGEDGLWRNQRLEHERARQVERRAALAANGTKGGRPRKQTESYSFPVDNQKKSLSSSSSSSVSDHSQRSASDAHAPEDTPEMRAGNFCEWYSEAHLRFVGVGYIGNPNGDYMAALRLVGKFTDAELRDAALVWFGQEDDFAKKGTRTIPKFASRASDCVLQARKVAS